MKKEYKYALIFGGAAVGAYIVVRVIQAIKEKRDGGNGDDIIVEEEVVTTGGSNAASNLPSFSKIVAASAKADFKASVLALQKAINRKLIGIAKEGEFISMDGYYGKKTYAAHLRVMPFAAKDINYMVANPTKAAVDSMTKFLNK